MAAPKQQTQPVVLITGAARRIGADIARAFSAQGYLVAIHYHTSEHCAQQLKSELNAKHANRATTFNANLCDITQVKNLAEKVIAKFKRCDLLINNASAFYPTPLENATEQDWETLFCSNVKAPFFLSQALAPQLAKNNGAIINIADIHAQRPLKHHSIYSMAKAANMMMTQSLALELAPNIRVNSISPGASLWPESNNGEKLVNEAILEKIPLKELGGTQSIVDTALFLACHAPYITGQNINVDGGRSLRQ